MAQEPDPPTPEGLKRLVARVCGAGSRGVGSLTYEKAPELHGHAEIKRLVAEGASETRLDGVVRQLITDAAGPTSAPAAALVGAHPETTGQSRPKRRKKAVELAKSKSVEYFARTTEGILIQSMADGLALSAGLSLEDVRQLQYEYEFLSRDIEYAIDPDDHLRVEQNVRLRIRALGAQVRLVNLPYTRRQTGGPPKPTILSPGHKLLDRPQAEPGDVPGYFFAIYLGRPLAFGEEETVEYSQVFQDKDPSDPWYWLRIGNPYVGAVRLTIRLPRTYIENGLAFVTEERGGATDSVLWTESRSFSRKFPDARVDPTPSRAVIRWTIQPGAMGRRYGIRWTNERVQTLDDLDKV